MPVEGADGKSVRLGDVADVVEGHQPLAGDAVINDGPGLLLVVEKFPWGNTLEVTQASRRRSTSCSPGCPASTIDTHDLPAGELHRESIDNLTRALLLGALLVVLVLVAFLFEWRTALISLIAIPLSLMAAGLVLYLRGDTINTMVLAGLVIAVGVVVDDAIIDVENIVRRLRQHRAEGSARLASQASSSRPRSRCAARSSTRR